MKLPPTHVEIGDIKLFTQGDKLFAHHKALAKPVEINAKMLERWLKRQLRETLQ